MHGGRPRCSTYPGEEGENRNLHFVIFTEVFGAARSLVSHSRVDKNNVAAPFLPPDAGRPAIDRSRARSQGTFATSQGLGADL